VGSIKTVVRCITTNIKVKQKHRVTKTEEYTYTKDYSKSEK